MDSTTANRRKKLILLVPTLQLGGQERVAVNTADIMKDTYDVTMIVFDSRNAVFSPSCKMIDFNCPALPGTFNKIKNVIQRVIKLNHFFKKESYDFCLSFGQTANLVNVLSLTPAKKIVSLRTYWDTEQNIISKIIFRFSDRILCCSRKIQSHLLEQLQSCQAKIFCIQNPYDFKELLSQSELDIDDYSFGSNVIVSHGRLDEVKNQQQLIKAFSLVVQQIPDAQLLIIGEGEMRAYLEGLIIQYDLTNQVTLLGFRKNPFAYLSRAAVYALTSYTEGFPNSMVEAMFFLPVISVDCKSGPREILSDGSIDCVCSDIEEADYGILIPPAKTQERNSALTDEDKILADALLSILKDPEKHRLMKGQARLRANQFSYDNYRDKLIQVLEK